MNKTNPKYVPQMAIRSGLRGGESVEACQRNVDHWKAEYERQLQRAKDAGRKIS